MTRKKKKQKRVKKQNESRKNKSAKRKENEAFKSEVKSLAKILDNLPQPRSQKYTCKRITCPDCGKQYCWIGGFQDNYCDECYVEDSKEAILAEGGIFTGCQLPITAPILCLDCRWK